MDNVYDNDVDRVRELRFMRNVFRSLGLVVILSSTNSTARYLVDAVDPLSQGSVDALQPLSPWCVVFPPLPRFRDDLAMESVDARLTSILLNSRPLFAREALELIRKQRLLLTSTMGDFVEFVDALAEKLVATCLV